MRAQCACIHFRKSDLAICSNILIAYFYFVDPIIRSLIDVLAALSSASIFVDTSLFSYILFCQIKRSRLIGEAEHSRKDHIGSNPRLKCLHFVPVARDQNFDFCRTYYITGYPHNTQVWYLC